MLPTSVAISIEFDYKYTIFGYYNDYVHNYKTGFFANTVMNAAYNCIRFNAARMT